MAAPALLHVNDSTRVDSTAVRYFYDRLENQQLGNVQIWDTTTLLASFYDPTNQLYEYYQELSGSGHAHNNMEFSFPAFIGFNDRLPSYEKFIITKDKIRYPIVYQPFTEIKYMVGSKKEQHLGVLFCRQLLPRFYLTLCYNIDFAPSVYIRSYAQNYYFMGNFRWNTRNGRYGLNGYYFTNKVDVYENGGITHDSIFTDLIETDKSVIDVNLSSASNLLRVSGFGLNQHFVLSDSDKPNDTVNRRRIGLGRINYSFDFQKNSYVYNDKDPLSSFYSAYDAVLDSTQTFDSLSFYTIRNEISWSSLTYGKYNNDIPFYLTFGAEHNYTQHNGYTDLLTGERFGKVNYQNIRVKAGIIINLFKSTRITGKGELILSDYQAGDFILSGQWKQFLGTYTKNIGALVFDVNLSRKSPDWFEEYYYSNNFRWQNDFSPATYMRLSGSYQIRWITLGLKQTTIDHYIYFGENAKPVQYTGTLNVTSAYAKFDVKLRHFEIAGMASMQVTDNDNVLHLPLVYGKLKLGWNIRLVKGVSILQPAVVINYFTEYYADAYMPALRVFHLQNDVKIGNYPFLDINLTIKLKRANLYVAYTNVYSLSNDNRYFTTPHYPMRDSKIMFGLRWRLYK
ncbi:MAG: putative porin [Bacteroidales bacterium]|jgi:hypothetical protein|nr:putative porin [Bacteroidales bacterium]